MPISSARTAAFDILLRIEQQGAYASELLHAPRYAGLSGRDHALVTELVMGVMRWRSLLDGQIARHATQSLDRLDREVLTALRLAAYQMGFLERVPVRAALHESVDLVRRARKRSAVGFVNAVLRGLAKQGIQLEASAIAKSKDVEDLAQAAAHPQWLVERWVRNFGFEAARQICGHAQHAPGTAIHVTNATLGEELEKEGVQLAEGLLLTSARRVKSGDITKSRAYRARHVVIQDEASQLVALLGGNGTRILDCCAAPGGKTRILAERNPAADILAVELHPHRARLVRKLVPYENVRVLCANVSTLPVRAEFDLVLVDAPCTGTGTLARNPEIKWRLAPDDLVNLQARQQAILQSVMRHVAPGGRLVYSTCSLEPEENEEIIERVLASTATLRQVDSRGELERLRGEGELAWKDLNSLASGPYLRTIPGIHPCDGFFVAILQRI